MKYCLLCGVPLPQEYVDNDIFVCDTCEEECENDAESVMNEMFFAKSPRAYCEEGGY